MSCRTLRHLIPTVGLTLSTLAALVLPTSQVQAADPSEQVDTGALDNRPLAPVASPVEDPPIGRFEVVIKNILIHDDQDWGEGEFNFTVRFGHADDCSDPDQVVRWVGCLKEMARSAPIAINGNDGQSLSLDVPMPRAGDQFSESSVGAGIGIPLQPNRKYGIEITGVELDTVSDDNMGWTIFMLKEQEFWGEGRHRLRGLTYQGFLDSLEWSEVLPSNGFGAVPAYYTVEFEIRRVPLPDLVARPIRPVVLDDGRTTFCTTIANEGQRPAGAFQRVFRVDGTIVPNGTADTPTLDPGKTSDLCFLPTLSPGEHKLSLTVDERDTVAEMNDANNATERLYVAVAGASIRDAGNVANVGPSGTAPTEPTADEDLIIESIRVNGANNDCDPGKNTVTVVVKNQGTKASAGFTVKLLPDHEKSVSGLDAGKSLDVEFENIILKGKDHSLTAQVDSKNGVAESNETNNAKTIPITCSEEDN